MKATSKVLAVMSLVLAGGLTLYELTWWARSGVAKVLVGLGVSVMLLAVAVLIGEAGSQATRGGN